MALQFITGNENKFREVQGIIPELEQLTADLVEIQDIDPHKIIRAKLVDAFKHHPGPFIVDDTSLYLNCLNGLPGPLVKWFEKSMGLAGIYDIAAKMGDTRAVAKTIIGYARSEEDLNFFESELFGTVVSPVGENDFGWGAIFKPDGFEKTFGQMTRQEKAEIGMRHAAAKKLRDFLHNQG